jgi:hypothetical protein
MDRLCASRRLEASVIGAADEPAAVKLLRPEP